MKFCPPPVSHRHVSQTRGSQETASRLSKAIGGFTLLELLVVISIIGILAGLIFAAFSRVQQAAGAAKCSSSLRQWGMAYQNFSSENDGMTVQATEVAGDSNTQWQERIAPYLVGTKGTEVRRFEMRKQFHCPGDKTPGIVYGALLYLRPLIYSKAPTKLINLEPPPEKYLLMAENYTGELWDARPWDGRQGVDYSRHGKNGKANFLFADFHQEALTYDETLKLPMQFVP